MTRTQRFDSLRPGDQIAWRGADDDVAIVVTANTRTRTVAIEWRTNGQHYNTTLSWIPSSEVYMGDR